MAGEGPSLFFSPIYKQNICFVLSVEESTRAPPLGEKPQTAARVLFFSAPVEEGEQQSRQKQGQGARRRKPGASAGVLRSPPAAGRKPRQRPRPSLPGSFPSWRTSWSSCAPPAASTWVQDIWPGGCARRRPRCNCTRGKGSPFPKRNGGPRAVLWRLL